MNCLSDRMTSQFGQCGPGVLRQSLKTFVGTCAFRERIQKAYTDGPRLVQPKAVGIVLPRWRLTALPYHWPIAWAKTRFL